MIPKLQMSTLAPYSFRVTTSGAIQYGVPTMVVRLAWLGSEICAQNPKSARDKVIERRTSHCVKTTPTELDLPLHAEKNVVAFDVSVDDPVPM